MTDCPNGEIRDELPDYVHDRLVGAERARVAAHVASCPFCAAEVELLGAARRAITAAAPRIDPARIVAALPAPPRALRGPAIVRPLASARRPAARVGSWRMAAAIATIAVGSVSFAVIRDIGGGSTATGHQVSAPAVASNAVPPRVVAPAPVVAPPAVPPQVALQSQPQPKGAVQGEEVADNNVVVPDGGRLNDLSDDDVQSLLNDIDQLDGVPDANPQPAMAPLRTGGTL
jgi:anti-sigma factor RsiW